MDAGDDVCKSCGSPVQKMNRNWSKFAKISVITLIIAAFGAYIVLYNLDIIGPDFFGDIFGGGSVAVEEPLLPDAGYVGQETDETVDGHGEIAVERRSEEEHQVILSSVLEAVEAYVRDFSQFNPIISRMGYLHNFSSEEYVTLELLERMGYLGYEHLAEDIRVLYLRPIDLNQFNEIAFEGAPAGQMVALTVFLGYETPTGIGLYSRFGTQAIFRENLNHLLVNEYNPNNGAILRPTAQDAIYHAVVDMITDVLPGTDVFIRYLAVDDAHGFVAFSTAGDGHSIINYIFSLVYEDGSTDLRVLALGFEATQHPKAAINGAAPSFNFDLMPDYDIANVNLLASNTAAFRDILATMEQNGQIEEGQLPIFMSVTPTFSYIVLAYENAFFGQNHGDGWSIVAVGSWRAAESLMADNVNNPPLYIVWQQ
jgi:hypothetical protein